jgi:receptor protein-tyrosine kinase
MSEPKEPQFHSSLFPSDADLDIDIDDIEGNKKRNSFKRSIGSILVDAGIITMDAAYQIMELQREKKIRFGEAAVQLGLISQGDIRYALSFQYQYNYLPRASGKITNDELVAAYNPFSHEVDQLRAVRSQLLLRWFDKELDHGMLAIASAGRSEGGSYLAANLAIVFAQMGEKTLLIDSDMRSPRQHTLFSLNNQVGFSSLLAGRADVASALQTIQFIQNLQVLPAGPIPPNPLELLNRDNVDELLHWAASSYDIVLIDTASLAVGADALIVAGKAGAALTVARTNHTKTQAFRAMVDELRRAQINIVGSVLNNPSPVPVKR